MKTERTKRSDRLFIIRTKTLLYRPLPEMRSMAVIDLVNIVEQRLADIARRNPSLTTEELFFAGENGLWCLITIRGSEDRTIEHDFIESEESWKRPDAGTEYAQAAMDMIKVMVIVPDQALPDVLLQVRNYDAEGVSVADYTFMGLMPMPLIY